ncbi:gamma-glutamyl-gamma-aminobutyrate hydrolase family protein, partial [Halomonas sp. SIMBA_159]
ATRYHSLVIARETLPSVLELTAWVEDGTIMGVRHRDYPHLQGVQFHPESILTESGKQLLQNFLVSLTELSVKVA